MVSYEKTPGQRIYLPRDLTSLGDTYLRNIMTHILHNSHYPVDEEDLKNFQSLILLGKKKLNPYW